MTAEQNRTAEASRRARDSETARLAESADRIAFGITAGSMVVGITAAGLSDAHGATKSDSHHGGAHVPAAPQRVETAPATHEASVASEDPQRITAAEGAHDPRSTTPDSRRSEQDSAGHLHEIKSVHDQTSPIDIGVRAENETAAPGAALPVNDHGDATVEHMAAALDQTTQPAISMLDAATSSIASLISNVSTAFDQVLQAAADRIGGLFDSLGSTVSDSVSTIAPALPETSAEMDRAGPTLEISFDHTSILDQALGLPTSNALPNLEAYSELASTLHIGFIGESLANTIDPHDFGTHGSGSLLHGFV